MFISQFHDSIKLTYGIEEEGEVMKVSERLEKSRWYLIRQNLPISAIAQLCGYHNIPLFSRQFKQLFGLTPQNYRNQYKKSGDSSIPAESKKAAEKT